MALLLLAGFSLLTRNRTMFPQLTLDSLNLNGSKLTTPITYETSEKYYFQNVLHDEIVLKCTAVYAIKWTFGESPIYNSHIENINITTEKITAIIDNKYYNSTFISFLRIKFYRASERSLYNGSIGCQNAVSPSNVTWLEVGGNVNTGDRFKEISTFKIFRGPKINWSPKKPGENKNCVTHLIVDRDNGQLGCKWNRESVNYVGLRNVSNINEMDALITFDTNCKSAIMYHRCTKNCIPMGTIQSAAIVYCGYGPASLSMPIFKINSRLYFDLREARQNSDLRIIGPATESLYRNKPYEFMCTGTYSLYMKGFFWILAGDHNDTAIYIGNGADSFGENNQVISKKTIIFPDVKLYTVYCCAPDWSTNDSWSHVTTEVNISYHEPSSANTNFDIADRVSEQGINTISNEPKPVVGTEGDDKGKPEMTVIIATTASLCAIFMLSCTILLLIAFRKIRNQSRQLQLLTEEEIIEFKNGNPKAETALFLPYNMEFEIPKEQLYIGNTVLGEGNYGIVQKGRYGSLQVAVKTVKKSTNALEFKSLLSELKIMTYVGRHINIVHLVGACTKDLRKGYVCLVYEYCTNGNMQHFLKDSRKTFGEGGNASRGKTLGPLKDQKKSRATSWVETSTSSTTFAENLTLKDLILWSQQIASGMEYLSSKNIIHGDLAARNVLITDKRHAKLADFGLSKQLFDYSIYIQKQHCPLPLKWMAPESLRDMEFSVQSDIWSYGVTLWEIYSLGESPYPGVDWNYESWKMLCNGFRMDRPRYASPVLFKIILECWKEEPNERPTFKFLKDYFGEELQQMLLMPKRNFDRHLL